MTQALGGQAYLNVQDSSQEGRTYSFHHGQPNSLGVLYWRFSKFPDKERIEFTKKRDVAYVYNYPDPKRQANDASELFSTDCTDC